MAQPKTLPSPGGKRSISGDGAAAPSAVVDILGCEMEYLCTKLWSELVPTPDIRVRTCPDCKSQVTLCKDRNSLERSATSGQCVTFLSKDGNSVRMTVGLPSARGRLRAFLNEL